MIHEIHRLRLRILYSGKQAGNMDERFSSAGDIAKRREYLLDCIGAPFVVRMRASGGDTFVDLKDKSLINGWNEVAGDGLITDQKDLALVLLPADCIPLVIYSTTSSIRALVHVGRKGAELGVHKRVISYLAETYSQRLADLRLYIGPSIRPESYYFAQIEPRQQKDPRWSSFIQYKDGNYHIDMLSFVIEELLSMGFTQNQLEINRIDTGSNNIYFSHSRSVRTGEAEGRNTFVVTFA